MWKHKIIYSDIHKIISKINNTQLKKFKLKKKKNTFDFQIKYSKREIKLKNG